MIAVVTATVYDEVRFTVTMHFDVSDIAFPFIGVSVTLQPVTPVNRVAVEFLKDQLAEAGNHAEVVYVKSGSFASSLVALVIVT